MQNITFQIKKKENELYTYIYIERLGRIQDVEEKYSIWIRSM